MIFLQCSFKSEALQMMQGLNILLPKTSMGDEIRKNELKMQGFPVLYLLHGLSDDHSGWMRRTSIERYCEKYNLAVVMPNVNRSVYADMKYGLDYYTYVSKEIPDFVTTNFPISSKREDSYIAGLSMGGYGAFMIALRNPHMFSAAASLSGALDLSCNLDDISDSDFELMTKSIFGSKEEFLDSDYNLIGLMEKLQNRKNELPRLFQCCGTEDYIYPLNQSFKAAAEKYGIELTYEEGPGQHDWEYWDANIQRALKWFFNEI